MRLDQWLKAHEDDPRILLPKVVEQLNERRTFMEQYGKKLAAQYLEHANTQHTDNVRRARAVAVGLAAIRDKLASDPDYTAQQAQHDMDVLRSDYNRLKRELPMIALQIEDARAVDADPVNWTERHFERFPALADRLPGLPAF